MKFFHKLISQTFATIHIHNNNWMVVMGKYFLKKTMGEMHNLKIKYMFWEKWGK